MKQHNGELKGGAKASSAGRPWICACLIHGFKGQSEGILFRIGKQRLCFNILNPFIRSIFGQFMGSICIAPAVKTLLPTMAPIILKCQYNFVHLSTTGMIDQELLP